MVVSSTVLTNNMKYCGPLVIIIKLSRISPIVISTNSYITAIMFQYGSAAEGAPQGIVIILWNAPSIQKKYLPIQITNTNDYHILHSFV